MYDPNIHHRRSIRWRGHDYSSPGAYYVTICVEHYRCLLGIVSAGVMHLNDAGQMVSEEWQGVPSRFPTMQVDEFIVMPNHFHGILHIVGAPLVGALDRADLAPKGARAGTRPATLGDAIGAFKSLTTNGYITGVCEQGWPRFEQRFWQRNYYEHVIRDQIELEKIREYIRRNPLMWTCDRYNPEAPVLVVDDTGDLTPWEQT
jgi:REP-associated tyrosine transposase